MSGVWIKLHDVRVRIDVFDTTIQETPQVASCLSFLFDVPHAPILDENLDLIWEEDFD